ncbi:MAG: sigma 54-interacting transcriptional regulator [Syntrophomonas sp.]
MGYELNWIQGFVQQVSEAVAFAINIDIIVIDANRNMVATSAGIRDRTGQEYYHHGSLTDRLLTSGKLLISRNPGVDPECQGCRNYGACHHFFVVAYPIKVDNKVIGSFCITATTPEQRSIMLKRESRILEFLDRMIDLIGSAINERMVQNELTVLLKRYNYVIDSVHEGIIATDSDNNIVHINRSASRLLEVSEERLLGKAITSIFPDLDLSNDQSHKFPLETELDYRKTGKNRKKNFMGTVVSIRGNNSQHMGFNISIRNLSEVQSYASRLMGSYGKYNFDDIQGNSLALLQVKENLRKAALTDSTIVIRGESGTGKELFAHGVHNASYRADKNFIAINCSAIPDSLLESELFGYEEGAFTGAKKGGKPGKFELAKGGSIFLDEIGDMPLHLQSKLLRVLENRVIERVGGIEHIPIDVRIIAATNRNLEEMVMNHEFRDDLYYRLSVIPVFIPPLRERKEDIPILIEHFLKKFSIHMGRNPQKLDPQVQNFLVNFRWPGNIRELQNTIEYALNMSPDGHVITMEHLPSRLFYHNPINNIPLQESEKFYKSAAPPHHYGKLKDMEVEAVRQALDKFGITTEGKDRAAKYLGISIATLYRRLKEINSMETE